MKKMMLAMAAALLIGTTAMAQTDTTNVRRMKQIDKTELLKRRTENTARRYGLNDEQKARLLELNTKYQNVFRMQRIRPMRPMTKMRLKALKPDSVVRLRPDQRLDGRRAKLQTDLLEYNKEIKKIMTGEQYKRYQADMQERMLNPQTAAKRE